MTRQSRCGIVLHQLEENLMADTLELHPDHPDANCQPGEERVFEGRTYVFGKNQYSAFWRAGPKDGSFSCCRNYGLDGWNNLYRVGNVSTKDFESAARLARKTAKKEYERAKEIVARYEREE